jgi:hypothetical protein
MSKVKAQPAAGTRRRVPAFLPPGMTAALAGLPAGAIPPPVDPRRQRAAGRNMREAGQ